MPATLFKNEPLSRWSTIRLGGPCPELYACSSSEDVVECAGLIRSSGRSFVLIGGGSNILFSDQGSDAPMIRFAGDLSTPIFHGEEVEVSAGAALDDVVQLFCGAGWAGLEFCSGIPGTVGGGVAGNAGAWGRQLGDVLSCVRVLCADGKQTIIPGSELGFAYRNSDLKNNGMILLSVCFRLSPGDVSALLAERRRILQMRAEKHPDLSREPSLGSFFKNVEPTSRAGRREAAGWFLEQAGAKFLRVGGARLFEKHANIIVTDPGCKAEHVLELSRQMAALVQNRFGLQLQREIRLLGRFSGEPESSAVTFH